MVVVVVVVVVIVVVVVVVVVVVGHCGRGTKGRVSGGNDCGSGNDSGGGVGGDSGSCEGGEALWQGTVGGVSRGGGYGGGWERI